MVRHPIRVSDIHGFVMEINNMRIIYTRASDGGVSVVIPARQEDVVRSLSHDKAMSKLIAKMSPIDFMHWVRKRDVPKDAINVKIVDDSDIPDDRTFRDAWHHDGKEISVHMEKAREIHKAKLRRARSPLLEKLDTEFLHALEKGNKAKLKEIADEKQRLRDITAHPDIEQAATPDELKSVVL